MKYLNDTCIFLHKIITPQNLESMLCFYRKHNDTFCITNYIIQELEPGIFINDKNRSSSLKVLNCVNKNIKENKISLIDIEQNAVYVKNYEQIRKRYYDIDNIQAKKLIKTGKCTLKEIKELKKVHKGECSCIAVAMEDPENCIIVSDDNGDILFKGWTNLFKVYERYYHVMVWDFYTWSENTRYKNVSNR